MNTNATKDCNSTLSLMAFAQVLSVLLLGSVLFLALAFLSGCAVAEPLARPAAVAP